MTIRNLAMIGALIIAPSAAFAQDSGSMEDQMACTPDVYRLCSSLIPNESAIVACLQRNKASLSPDCHKVFSRPTAAAQPNEDDDQSDD